MASETTKVFQVCHSDLEHETGESCPCYPPWLDATKSIVESLIWPLTVLIVLLFFRKHLILLFNHILNNASQIEAGGVKISFRKLQANIIKEYEKSKSEIPVAEQVTAKFSLTDSYDELKDDFLKSMIKLDGAIANLAYGAISFWGPLEFSEVVSALKNIGEISERDLSTLQTLLSLRNRLVHEKDKKADVKAIKYATVLAKHLALTIEAKK